MFEKGFFQKCLRGDNRFFWEGIAAIGSCESGHAMVALQGGEKTNRKKNGITDKPPKLSSKN